MADFNDWTSYTDETNTYNYIKSLQALGKQQQGDAEAQGGLMASMGLGKVPEAIESLKKGYEAYGQLKEGFSKLPETFDRLGDIADKHLGALDENIEGLIGKVGNIGEKALNKTFTTIEGLGHDVGSRLTENIPSNTTFGDVIRDIRDSFTTLKAKPNTLIQQFEADPEDLSGHISTSRSFNLFNNGEKSVFQQVQPENVENLISKTGQVGKEAVSSSLGNLQKSAGEIAQEAIKGGEGLAEGAASSIKTLGEEGLGMLTKAGGEAAAEALGAVAGLSDIATPLSVIADVGLGLYSLIKGVEKPSMPTLPIPSLQIH